MSKIKDLLYDINDILFAILVVCIAAVIIFTRVDALMTYPEKMFSEPVQGGLISVDEPVDTGNADASVNEPGEGGDTGQSGDSADGAAGGADGTANGVQEGDGTANTEGGALGNTGNTESGVQGNSNVTGTGSTENEAYSLYIASGESMNNVASDLMELGLFDSPQDFFSTLERNNAASRVQAGTFTIPANSTKDEVVQIITGRSGQ